MFLKVSKEKKKRARLFTKRIAFTTGLKYINAPAMNTKCYLKAPLRSEPWLLFQPVTSPPFLSTPSFAAFSSVQWIPCSGADAPFHLTWGIFFLNVWQTVLFFVFICLTLPWHLACSLDSLSFEKPSLPYSSQLCPPIESETSSAQQISRII